jgi:hypothetical protein
VRNWRCSETWSVLRIRHKVKKSRSCENHNANERNLNSNYINPPPPQKKKIGNISKFINLYEVMEYFILKEYFKNARSVVVTGVLVTLQIICVVGLYRGVNKSCDVSKVPISFTFGDKQHKTLKIKALRPYRTSWTSRPTTLRRNPKHSNLHHYKKVTAGYLLPF